jgi:hypothetical protein
MKAKHYSWRKTNLFFQKVGTGTRFDALPLEVLKIIFKHKIIGEQLKEKEDRKIRVQQRKKKEEEEQQKRSQRLAEESREIQRNIRRRIKEKEDEKLRKKFGTGSMLFTAIQRRDQLFILGEEERAEDRRREQEFQRQQIIQFEAARRLATIRYEKTKDIDPFYLFHHCGSSFQ